MDGIKILGLKVDNVSLDEALDKIDGLIRQGGSHLVVTLGVEMVMRALDDPEFFKIVNDASLVVPDTVGILWAAKKSGHSLKERVPGIDILKTSARECEKFPWKVFFLGAKPGVAEMAAEKIIEAHPDYKVVGCHHGYFKDDDEIIGKIKAADPDILFVALGSPAQEKWFIKNREKFGNIVAIGVGGSLDVVSGTVKRAPAVFRKTGLEWFYRLITQPSRFIRMLALPAFALKVIFNKH